MENSPGLWCSHSPSGCLALAPGNLSWVLLKWRIHPQLGFKLQLLPLLVTDTDPGEERRESVGRGVKGKAAPLPFLSCYPKKQGSPWPGPCGSLGGELNPESNPWFQSYPIQLNPISRDTRNSRERSRNPSQELRWCLYPH